MNNEKQIKERIEAVENVDSSGLIRGMINAFVIEGLAIAVLVGTGLLLSLL
jgi:hypothetical protein